MAIGRIALCSVKGIITIREIEVEVTGNGYIDLTDAVVNKLLELKAYGGCVQDLTPTPSTPVDIVCNNGALKVKDKELPVGYVRVASIEFDGNTYYDTNEKLYGSDTISMKLDQSGSGGRNIFGAYTGTTAGNINYSFYGYNTATGQAYLRYGTSLYRPTIGTGIRTLTYGPGTTTGFATNVNITADTFETNDVAYIGALPNSSSPKYEGEFIGNIEVSSGGTTRLKWIPCKRKSDGVIGYYEVVNGNFLEPSGSGTPVAGAEDYSNIEVYVDGTKEKVGYSGGATTTCEDLLGVGDYKDEQEILSGNVIIKCGVVVLDGTETYSIVPSLCKETYNVLSTTLTNKMLDKEANKPIICSHFQSTNNNQTQINAIGQIAFNSSALYSKTCYFSVPTTITNNAEMQAYIKAIAPVIIVYPLATPTTLSVAGQSLSIPAGNSRIEIVEGSILNLPLYAKYKANE